MKRGWGYIALGEEYPRQRVARANSTVRAPARSQNGKTGAQSERRRTEGKPGRQLDKIMAGLLATVKN